MPTAPLSFSDVLLAFRQAKNTLAVERGIVGLFDLARFETQLATRIRRLRRSMQAGRWFDELDIGQLVIIPKSAVSTMEEHEIVHIGQGIRPRTKLAVRLQLQPTPDFATAEVLYLWKFGPALEALLDDSCLGYRLKHVRRFGRMDRYARGVYDYWPEAFRRYREEPIEAARRELERGKHVVVTSTDVVSFFDFIDPTFLVNAAFVDKLTAACRRLGRSFSIPEYRRATASLLAKFAQFRRQRRTVGGKAIDVGIGVPIGALTSRVIANVALAGLDGAVRRQPNVVHYSRYVDDIVVVSTRPAESPLPERKVDVLATLFPGFSSAAAPGSTGYFSVPDTGATFMLNEGKTRVHDLFGPSGVDFLAAVRTSFSAVASERRAFLGNVERLTTEFEGVDLFSDGATGTDRIPRLRDADRFTLRRFLATAYVRGLERCVLLLDAKEAAELLEQRTQRLLSILGRTEEFEDFDLVLALLKVALLCDCNPVVVELERWLAGRSGAGLSQDVIDVTWRGARLHRRKALEGVRAYLAQRIREAIASACAPPSAESRVKHAPTVVQEAALLRRTDLRHLDREDDLSVFGRFESEQTEATRREHANARRAIAREPELSQHFKNVRAFLDRARDLSEDNWGDVSDVSLSLSTRPPRYMDVSRRFLARIEKQNGQIPDVGREIARCVDALRGTRYSQRRSPLVSVENDERTVSVNVDGAWPAPTVRVILANLPSPPGAFEAAATNAPLLTFARLQALDRALRDARRAARGASRHGLPSLVVFPELSIPLRWARAVSDHAVREDLSIVAGLEYFVSTPFVVNQALGVFPSGMRTAAVVRWTKRNPARVEADALRALGRVSTGPARNLRRLVIESVHGRIGVLICSEILEASALTDLRGRIELLLVPAWNRDTPSFDYIVHASSSMLVHSFVSVANNAEFSDARIVAPIYEPRHERDWCRLVHRGETRIVWGDLPIAELRNVHDTAPLLGASALTIGKRTYRPLPPGWMST